MVELNIDYFVTSGLWSNQASFGIDHEALIGFVKHVYGLINLLLTCLWFDYDWFACVWFK
jgi:hypothetical protein